MRFLDGGKAVEMHGRGEQLVLVGGGMVVEVLLDLIDADPRSYRAVMPNGTPELPSQQERTFGMADSLRFAGGAMR